MRIFTASLWQLGFCTIPPRLSFKFGDGSNSTRLLPLDGFYPNSWDCENIQPVPYHIRQTYQLDYFYQKYTHAYGIPILSSSQVRDSALRRACYTVRFMLGDRLDLRQAQYQNKGRVMIMAEYPKEKTTDVPEHAYLKDDPYTDWDERARGLGGTLHLPLSSVGEENVLCLNGDRYYNQDILVHEFGHGIHHVSAEYVDPSFTSRLQSAYNTAISRGLWANTYAGTNYIEYFAVGVQCYFDNSGEGPVGGDGIHNNINTRWELYNYDSRLYSIVAEVFPCANEIIQRCDNQSGISNHRPPMNCGGSNPPPTDPPSGGDCQDLNEYCEYWASTGECQNNPGYMLPNCPKSCNACGGGSSCIDEGEHCEYWASTGECQNNPGYMLQYCKKSCNVC